VFTLQQVCDIEAKTLARMHFRFMRKLRRWPVSTVHLKKFLKHTVHMAVYFPAIGHWYDTVPVEVNSTKITCRCIV